MAKLLFVVCAAHDGYRRGGVRFNKGENTVDTGPLSEEQLEQIENDPLLIVGEYAEGRSLEEPAALSQLLPEQAGEGHAQQGTLVSGTLPGDLALQDVQLLEQAFLKLEPDNKDHFNAKDLPNIAVLEKLLGRKVSAAERDEAWAAFKAKQAAAANEKTDQSAE